MLERMDGGRFHTVHSSTTKAVCAASNKRPTTAKGAQAQPLDTAHAIGLALAAGPERWTAMEGGYPIIVDGECIGGIGVSAGTGSSTTAWRAPRSTPSAPAFKSTSKQRMAFEPVRVGCLGMGWWSDVLADAIARSGGSRSSPATRAPRKARGVRGEVRLPRRAGSYEAMLGTAASRR